MEIIIKRDGENIVTAKDLEDIEDRGEVAHIICELESIKKELLKIWEDMKNG